MRIMPDRGVFLHYFSYEMIINVNIEIILCLLMVYSVSRTTVDLYLFVSG